MVVIATTFPSLFVLEKKAAPSTNSVDEVQLPETIHKAEEEPAPPKIQETNGDKDDATNTPTTKQVPLQVSEVALTSTKSALDGLRLDPEPGWENKPLATQGANFNRFPHTVVNTTLYEKYDLLRDPINADLRSYYERKFHKKRKMAHLRSRRGERLARLRNCHN